MHCSILAFLWLQKPPGYQFTSAVSKMVKTKQVKRLKRCAVLTTQKQNTCWHRLAKFPLSSLAYIFSFIQIGSALGEL